jgi:hypothetical protein
MKGAENARRGFSPVHIEAATTDRALVAGEPQKVAPVVHEFMHVHATEQRRRPLFRPDEIDREHENEAGENRPGQHLAYGNRNGLGSWCKYG